MSRIVAEFADTNRPPKVKDRRAEPSAGYRAVHVVVTVQDVPVEIQVRTARQDEWAQLVEALADKWGRGIRYGDDPEQPDEPAAPGAVVTRRETCEALQSASVLIAAIEEVRDRVGRGAEPVLLAEGDPAADGEQATARLEVARVEELVRKVFHLFRGFTDGLQ